MTSNLASYPVVGKTYWIEDDSAVVRVLSIQEVFDDAHPLIAVMYMNLELHDTECVSLDYWRSPGGDGKQKFVPIPESSDSLLHRGASLDAAHWSWVLSTLGRRRVLKENEHDDALPLEWYIHDIVQSGLVHEALYLIDTLTSVSGGKKLRVRIRGCSPAPCGRTVAPGYVW